LFLTNAPPPAAAARASSGVIWGLTSKLSVTRRNWVIWSSLSELRAALR
jgi:hypothetical protein